MTPPKKLWKSTITVWTDHEPTSTQAADLMRGVSAGIAFGSSAIVEEVTDPQQFPDTHLFGVLPAAIEEHLIEPFNGQYRSVFPGRHAHLSRAHSSIAEAVDYMRSHAPAADVRVVLPVRATIASSDSWHRAEADIEPFLRQASEEDILAVGSNGMRTGRAVERAVEFLALQDEHVASLLDHLLQGRPCACKVNGYQFQVNAEQLRAWMTANRPAMLPAPAALPAHPAEACICRLDQGSAIPVMA